MCGILYKIKGNKRKVKEGRQSKERKKGGKKEGRKGKEKEGGRKGKSKGENKRARQRDRYKLNDSHKICATKIIEMCVKF